MYLYLIYIYTYLVAAEAKYKFELVNVIGHFPFDCSLDLFSFCFPYVHCLISISDLYAGSKDETFFDSNVWLDSDCDDDFLSVNGGKIC